MHLVGWDIVGFFAIVIASFNLICQILVALLRLFNGLYDPDNQVQVIYLAIMCGWVVIPILLSDVMVIIISAIVLYEQSDYIKVRNCVKLRDMSLIVLVCGVCSFVLKVALLSRE